MTILQRDSILKPYRFLLKTGLIKMGLIKTGLALSLALIGVCMSAAVFDVRAQQTPYYDLNTPEVTVDLSVLNDGGLGAPRVGAVSPSVGGGTLLMPGGQAPTSRLLVTPPRKPSAAPRAARGTVERKPRKPRKARAETKTAKAAPKPPPKPMAKPAVKKAPKPDSKRTAVAQKPDSAPVSSAPPPPPAIPGAPDIASAPPPTPTSLAPEKKTATAPAAPADKEQASAAPDASSIAGDGGKSVRVVFAETSAKVPGAMTAPLKSLADQLNAKDTLRLQLKAYAGGQDMTPSKARRLSLSRALSVRSQLISAGVRSTRIDVRALGDKTTEEPLNRVDVAIVER